MDGMTSVIITGLLLKLVTAIIAFFAIRVSLRQFDRISGINFKKWYSNASTFDQAVYFCGRNLAVCILFGLILSS